MKKIIQSESAPAAIGPYSQAVEANGMLFVSGQVPVDPSTGKVVEGGIKEQTRQVLKNIGAILDKAGYSYDQVVKSTCFLSDMKNFAAMNEVYGSYIEGIPPARTTIQAARLPMDINVEIDVIALA
jgi:2-iminobutanoate/2-iminopropanoate deaminase